VLSEETPELTRIGYRRVGWILREDGSRQLTLGGWPLYRYTGDKKPGQWRGQGEGGQWYAVLKSGKPNRNGVAQPSEPAPEASADEETVPGPDPGGYDGYGLARR
jgi:hypothetical protein